MLLTIKIVAFFVFLGYSLGRLSFSIRLDARIPDLESEPYLYMVASTGAMVAFAEAILSGWIAMSFLYWSWKELVWI